MNKVNTSRGVILFGLPRSQAEKTMSPWAPELILPAEHGRSAERRVQAALKMVVLPS
ncbi:hypothetical protein ACRRTK_024597 [Alexandromys fortis]